MRFHQKPEDPLANAIGRIAIVLGCAAFAICFLAIGVLLAWRG